VLDALQWADNSSCDLLAYLVHQVRGSPVLIAGTCRDSELPPAHPLRTLLKDLQREQAIETMSVQPLSDEQIRALVATLPDPIVHDIQARAAGNPFFAEELARTSDGPARLPDTIAAVLDLRLGRVSDACQRVLTRAAVLGGSFEFRLLRAMESGPGAPTENTLLDLLEEALEAGILAEEGSGTRTLYAFWHPLAVSHLYARLSSARRTNLHHRAAEALEESYTTREQQGAARIVYHLVNGNGDPQRIAHFAELAGDQAYTLSAYPEATRHYRVALDALDTLAAATSGSQADRLHLANLLERLGECERVQGHDENACHSFERALALRSRPGTPGSEEPQLIALLWVEIGKTWYDRREYDQAQHCYRRAEELLRDAGIEGGPAWASLLLQEGYAFWQAGDFEQATLAATRALEWFESAQLPSDQPSSDRHMTATQRTLAGDPIDPGRAHLLLGTVAAVAGDREALPHLQEALSIFERYDRPREIAMICCNLGDYYLRQAALTHAQAALRRSLSTAERIGDIPIMSVSAGNLGLIAARLGDLHEAERSARHAAKLAEQMRDPFYVSLWHSYLAAALLEQGKIEQAKNALRQALSIGRAIQSTACVGVALVVLGQVRLAQALQHQDATLFLEKASRLLSRARAISDLETETRLEAQLVQARVALVQGDLEAARQDTQQVLDVARRDGLMGIQAVAQRQLGTIQMASMRWPAGQAERQGVPLTPWHQAESLFKEALATFKQLGMHLEYARTLRDYGAALLQRDDSHALSLLHEARSIFSACHAALDLDLVERVLATHQGSGATTA